MRFKSLLVTLSLVTLMSCKSRSFEQSSTESLYFEGDSIYALAAKNSLLWKSTDGNVYFGECTAGKPVEARFCKSGYLDSIPYREFVDLVNEQYAENKSMNVEQERADIEQHIRDLHKSLNAPDSVVSREAKKSLRTDLGIYQKRLSILSATNAKVQLIAQLNLPSPINAHQTKLTPGTSTVSDVYTFLRTVFATYGKLGKAQFKPLKEVSGKTLSHVESIKIQNGQNFRNGTHTGEVESPFVCVADLEGAAAKPGAVYYMSFVLDKDGYHYLAFKHNQGILVCPFVLGEDTSLGRLAAEFSKVGVNFIAANVK